MPNLAGDFFRSTVKPTVDEFLTNPLDIRRGRLAAIVLYHMADYWTEERHTGKHGELQKLHKELIGKCPGFQLIRDVADASKHAKLSEQKALPRSLSSSGQITASEGCFTAPFGTGVFAEAAEIIAELDDGTKRSLIESVRSVLSMWESMLTTP